MASKNVSTSPNPSFQIPRFAHRMVEIQSGMMSCQKAGRTGPTKIIRQLVAIPRRSMYPGISRNIQNIFEL